MKRYQKGLLILSVILCLLALVGCQDKIGSQQNKDSIHVYFYNTQNGNLETQEVKVVIDQNAPSEQKMTAVIEALYKGPQSTTQVTKPFDLHIKEANLKERVAYVTFEESYNQLSAEDRKSVG